MTDTHQLTCVWTTRRRLQWEREMPPQLQAQWFLFLNYNIRRPNHTPVFPAPESNLLQAIAKSDWWSKFDCWTHFKLLLAYDRYSVNSINVQSSNYWDSLTLCKQLTRQRLHSGHCSAHNWGKRHLRRRSASHPMNLIGSETQRDIKRQKWLDKLVSPRYVQWAYHWTKCWGRVATLCIHHCSPGQCQWSWSRLSRT